ncbi:hypothetical protein [Streptomyces candidus]|uniref:Uncharacterized protein n=1 Tax=Streptomyces candidus TaxID=67283 RepID=A0A7X0HIH3_9ACTN|nr:hypothetical protein [Streptomyces candidus]MBB6438294.1 hypothetical protein [Streptomyces candidus]GHH51877.1 hypothetical protein GCM10018773_50980 [Streptomyces candidus]
MTDRPPMSPAPPAPGRLRRWWHARRTGSRTRHLLERHLALALVLSLVGAGTLLVSYRAADRAAYELRTASEPAVVDVASTRLALLRSYDEAYDSVDSGLAPVVDAGEEYRAQWAVAFQGHARLARNQIDGSRGRAIIEPLYGLMGAYAQSVNLATTRQVDSTRADELLRRQRLREAHYVLQRPVTGMVSRLDLLQTNQLEKVEADVSFGPGRYAGWAVAELALVALFVTVLSALRVLRRRCGRRYEPSLVAALLLTAALAVLPLWAAVVTHHRLDDSYQSLRALATDAVSASPRVEDAQQTLADRIPRVHAGLADDGRPPWVYYSFLTGGVLICVLPVAGCVRRLNADYWRAAG